MFTASAGRSSASTGPAAQLLPIRAALPLTSHPSRTPQVLATGGADGCIKVWDISKFDGRKFAEGDMRQEDAMVELAHWQVGGRVQTALRWIQTYRHADLIA